MGETKHDGLAVSARAALAREPAFSLGSIGVNPPTRQVIIGGERHTIEPRVMQVLVVLSKAQGAVVSRDELTDRCWDGRIVGDDAINHAIGKLRQLSVSSSGAFAIETIPRVGYRLSVDGQPVPNSDLTSPERSVTGPSRRALITSAIAVGAIALGGASISILSRGHKPPRLAEMYYQRGLATRGQGYPNEYEQAVGYFRQAVQIDPDYADAWGALAWSYRVLLSTQDRSDTVRLTKLARSAAQRAIELDADNADARLALLLLQPHYRRWAEIERGCRHLLEQHPEHSITQFHLAFVLGDTGRWREAIPHMEAVCNREPTWPMARFRLFEELANAGRVEEADARIDEAMRLAPRNGDFWSSKIDHMLLTGRRAEAVALVSDETAQPIDDERLVAQKSSIVQAFSSGSRKERAAVVDSLLHDSRTHTLESARIAAMLGQLDTAFSLFDGFYLGRGPWAGRKNTPAPTHPLFSAAAASLRDDERFNPLLEEVGLEAFWRETKIIPDYRRFRPT